MRRHKHRCGFEYPDGNFFSELQDTGKGCGRVFDHSNECFGNRQAHVCTHCGNETWDKYYGDLEVGEGER